MRDFVSSVDAWKVGKHTSSLALEVTEIVVALFR